MDKCIKCVFYRIKPSSLKYNLNECLKHNTFANVALSDEKKCGSLTKDFVKRVVLDLHI